MIRVLHVVGKMHRGGIESLIMGIYKNIDRNKLQFDFLCNEKGDFDDEIIAMGGRIYYITPRNKSIKMNYTEIYNICKNNKDIKIIHNHLSSLSYLEPIRAAKNAGIKVRILHSHNNNMDYSFLRKLLIIFNKIRMKGLCTDYFACSNEAGIWMFGEHIWNEKGILIKNGIDSKKFLFNDFCRKKYRKEMNLNDKFVVGFIGRFESQKNPLFLIDVFSISKKLKNNAILLFIGEGSLHEEMNKKLENLNLLDSTYYTGVIKNVNEYINTMDVLVQPSLFEGLGIIFIEAQTNSLKCIGSDKVPDDAKISNYFKKLSLDKSAKEWAQIIIQESKNYKRDINMKDKIYQEEYDIELTAKKIEKIYLKRGNYVRK